MESIAFFMDMWGPERAAALRWYRVAVKLRDALPQAGELATVRGHELAAHASRCTPGLRKVYLSQVEDVDTIKKALV
jgi:hypothetical protein